jgi:hypothetical protein
MSKVNPFGSSSFQSLSFYPGHLSVLIMSLASGRNAPPNTSCQMRGKTRRLDRISLAKNRDSLEYDTLNRVRCTDLGGGVGGVEASHINPS